jgi:UDP-glucose 4-epimerase
VAHAVGYVLVEELGSRVVRAIVTGGAGFIGSHLVDSLVARGDEVVALDDLSRGRWENVNDRVRLVVSDIRDADAVADAFAEARPDVCFHLAAQPDVRLSVERPDFDCEVNVLGTIQVLEAARAHDAQVILASTGGAIYGECAEPAAEDSPRLPLSPYGTSKLAAEEYLATYNRLHGTRHVALRFANVYGPRQDPHGEAGVVAIFLGRLARGETPQIFGDGRQTRDYVFVGDVAQASLAAAGRDAGVYNVGTGRETSVLELYDSCRRASGSEAEPSFAPARLGELQRSFLDPALATAELGFTAETSLDDGIAATWDHIGAEGEGEAGAN